MLILIASLAIFGTPAVTMAPLFAKNLLGVGPEGLGGMLSAVGLGAVAAAMLMASRGEFRRKGAGVLAASAGFAVSLAGFALSRRYALSLACLALLGGSMTSTASLVNTLLQKNAPDRMRGRVISLYALAWLGLVPLGNLQAGIVAERVRRGGDAARRRRGHRTHARDPPDPAPGAARRGVGLGVNSQDVVHRSASNARTLSP